MRSLILAAAALPAVAGAVDLRPDSLSFELDHLSHASQHRPLTAEPHEYGMNIAALVARWQLTPRLSLAVSDGATLEACRRTAAQERICGSFYGPREVFQARLSFTLWSK